MKYVICFFDALRVDLIRCTGRFTVLHVSQLICITLLLLPITPRWKLNNLSLYLKLQIDQPFVKKIYIFLISLIFLRCMGTPPVFFSHFTKGNNNRFFPVCFPRGQSSPVMGSALERKNCSLRRVYPHLDRRQTCRYKSCFP